MKYYLDEIQSVISAGIPKSRVRYYIQGEPQNIPKEVAEQGFILLVPLSESINAADTSRDEATGVIRIVVGIQVREDYNRSDYTQEHLMRCLDIFEGRAKDGTLKTDTVLHLLRQAVTDIGLNEESLEVDYSNQRDELYIYAIGCELTFYDQRTRS